MITVLSVETERRRDCKIGELVKAVLLFGAAFSEIASKPERKNARAPGVALLWRPLRNAAAENVGVGRSAESSRVCNIVSRRVKPRDLESSRLFIRSHRRRG